MAKIKSPTADAVFSSLKDSAYQQAGAAKTVEDVARYAIENISGFPKECSDEAKEELVAGYRMKYNQLHPAQEYAVIDGHYVQATEEHKANKSVEKIAVGIEFAFSYSSQEFGKLKNTNPALHAVVGAVREKTSTYCSNRFKELKSAAASLLNAGKGRARTANKDFSEYIADFFKDTAPTRLKSAKARGDNTADETRWNNAKVAFMVQWNK
jgi:hypothetical protein